MNILFLNNTYMILFFQSCNLLISFSCKDITQYVRLHSCCCSLFVSTHTCCHFSKYCNFVAKNYKHKICTSKIRNTVDFYNGVFIRLITSAVFYTPIRSEIISAFIFLAPIFFIVKIYSTIISNR